jgi:flavin reductase (DIM6/NTAB) family NADH-FMN oxidoreductase RutF/DNA-binding MarR family transcriptional regulator
MTDAQTQVAPPDSSIDKAYRACLGTFATGITVITSQSQGEPVGVTANSFSSLSLKPRLVMWALARTSRSYAAFQAADRFVVNILGADQISVSQAFSSRQRDKFAGVSWRPTHCGPVIEGAAAVLSCNREAVHDGGDHLLLIGRVVGFDSQKKDSLLFVRGRYGVAADHPDLRESSSAGSERDEPPLLALLLQAYQTIAARFEQHRRKLGLNLTQSKVLLALSSKPLAVDQLANELLLGSRECRDVIDDLTVRRFVSIDPQGLYRLTEEGREQWAAVRRMAESFEKTQFQALPGAQLDAGRAFLRKITESCTYGAI